MTDHRYALIMAGGRGTRFWPRSRKRSAKQVLPFFGEQTLIQQTVARLEPLVTPDRIWIITNEYLREQIQQQLPAVPRAQIIGEPAQRNTAPCIALTAQLLHHTDPRAVMGVFPADHLITREDRLRRYAEAAYQSAETNDVVVLGIQPRWAETGYGYIEFPKDVAPGSGETIRVVSFREKPDSKTAARFVEAGNFFWNAGMFFWRAARVLDLMREHLPKTADLISRLPGLQSGHFESALTDLYPQCENISIDYAVIEKAKNVSGIPLDDIGWNDVGSWDAVYELAQKDEQGNANTGEVLTLASSGNYVSAQKLVALVGVDHLVVVDTPDALLVVNRSKAQDVSKIVKLLEAQNREELL